MIQEIACSVFTESLADLLFAEEAILGSFGDTQPDAAIPSAMAELSSDAYIVLIEGRIATLNPAAVTLFGAADQDYLLNRSFDELVIASGDRQSPLSSAGGDALTFRPAGLIRLDGCPSEIEFACIDGVHAGRAAVIVLARQRPATLIEEPEGPDNLLSTVSHELRSPLSAVRGYASTLLEYYDRLELDEIREYILGIDSAAQHLEMLVTDLLTHSTIENGRLRLSFTEVKLGAFLRDALATHRFKAPVQDFRLVSPPNEPAVSVDAVRLLQVVDNLIDNALRHGGSENPISISVTYNADSVCIGVRDHGDGVPAESLQAIFEPFVRVTPLGRHLSPGTGLGLAVCKGIVQAHAGRIWAELPRDGGFRVKFRLPLT